MSQAIFILWFPLGTGNRSGFTVICAGSEQLPVTVTATLQLLVLGVQPTAAVVDPEVSICPHPVSVKRMAAANAMNFGGILFSLRSQKFESSASVA
jgi:hypothetical protein